MNGYLSKYEEIYERLKNVMQSVADRLNGKDPAVVYTPSPEDLAFSHLSGVMKKLKQNMTKVIAVTPLYCSLPTKRHITCNLRKKIVRMMYFCCLSVKFVGKMQIVSSLREVGSELLIMIPSRCRKMTEAVNKRMMMIEQKVQELQDSSCTLDMALSMQEVANNLESLQEDMGGVEEFEAVMDKMRMLDQDLEEMDMKIDEMNDDIDIQDYLDELDVIEKEEAERQAAQLPEAPTTAPKMKEVEMKEKKRMAELECIVCWIRTKRGEMG